jgi:hypothetical protein
VILCPLAPRWRDEVAGLRSSRKPGQARPKPMADSATPIISQTRLTAETKHLDPADGCQSVFDTVGPGPAALIGATVTVYGESFRLLQA